MQIEPQTVAHELIFGLLPLQDRYLIHILTFTLSISTSVKMFKLLNTLKMKLRSKISSMKEKRRRRNLGRKDSLYPIDVPLHLSQIDLGEELTRVPSLTSLQEAEQTEQTGEPLSRVPSLTSLFSDFNFDCEQEQEVQTDESTEAGQTEQTGQPLSRVPSLTSLFSDFNFDCEHEQQAQTDESTEAEQTEQTGQPLSRVPSLTSLFSDFNFDYEHEQEAQTDESTEVATTEETVEPSCQEMQWAVDTRRNVQLVELRLSSDCKLGGTVVVANLAYHKNVFVRWTADNWASYQDQVASYAHSSDGYSHDCFVFCIDSPLLRQEGGVCVELAVAYQVDGQEFWDNNQQQNFDLLFHSSTPETISMS